MSDEILTEKYSAIKYYVHNSYVNTTYYVYKYLEKWLAKNIFRNDTSRVFLASDEYAFRRRFELTDMSQNYEEMEFSSLHFPFANYFPLNSGWEFDTRLSAKNASLALVGTTIGNTKVKASASIITIPITLWFDREDDARLAYEVLYFKSYNEQYDDTTVRYGTDRTQNGNGGMSIGLPMNITVNSIRFNPEYNEMSWLKKQRLFTIKLSLSVRTFLIAPPSQPDYTLEVHEDGTMSDGSIYEDGYNYYYIVDDVILNMDSNNDSNVKIYTYNAGYDITRPKDDRYIGSNPFPKEGERSAFYVDSYLFDSRNNSPRIYVWDEENHDYIPPNYDYGLNSYRYSKEVESEELLIDKFDCKSQVSKTTCVLSWQIQEEFKDKVKGIEIHLASNSKVINLSLSDVSYNEETKTYSYKLTKLTPNSTYVGYIVFKGEGTLYKKYPINFITNPSTSQGGVKGNNNSIVGLSW